MIFIPFAAIALGLTIYWLTQDILPLYGRIYKNAPIVETPYLGFFLLMAAGSNLSDSRSCNSYLAGQKIRSPSQLKAK